MSLKFERLFTKADQDVFDCVNYKLVDCIIKTSTGKIISKLINLEMPEHWSQQACDICAHKYFRKAGVANDFNKIKEEGIPVWLARRVPVYNASFGSETSIKQIVTRLAGCWTYNGWINDYFASEDDAKVFFDEMCYMLLHQICAPNSPQWFNTGLYWFYGIDGNASGEHYALIDGKIDLVTSAYKYPQVHACFILDVEDKLIGKNGIMDTWTKEAAIFKYGSGVGANFSNIRGEGEELSGGGKSSGLMSFLKIGDTAAGAIKSGGTTRRAAKMVILDCDHPDIEEFVSWKAKEERKVLALVTGSLKCKQHTQNIVKACESVQGNYENSIYLQNVLKTAIDDGVAQSYCDQVLHLIKEGKVIDFEKFDYDWNSEAYRTVSGQNSNNSIRVTDKFLRAVQNNDIWELKNRTDGKVVKTLQARDLWEKICYNAWTCADPGIQFQDVIDIWHTCKASGKITGTNPCSEYIFLSNTACNLASINLEKMLYDDGKFNVQKFEYVCRLLTVVLDISVQMAQYPTYDFAVQSHKFRTLGLGYSGLGSMLMMNGLAYDSDEARNLTSAITAIMTWTAYNTSAELAKEIGAFSEYHINKEHMQDVLKLMKQHTDNINHVLAPKQLAEKVLEKGRLYGFRNAQVSCIAPTGTISFVMDCGSTSCEPSFSLVSWKKLAGGGDMRILNPCVKKGLSTLGYTQQQQQDIYSYVFGHGNLQYAPNINHKTLLDKGFTQTMIDKINYSDFGHIKYAIHRDLFTPEEQMLLPNHSNILEVLFSASDIMNANLYCYGHLSIEGAKHLLKEHEDVFTCAVSNGVGTKTIDSMGHVKMLAAIQPFISGASSKTVNLPHSATLKDISDIYLQTRELGVKCIAIYRDNSKLSQALNTSVFNKITNVKEGNASRIGMKLGGNAFYLLIEENANKQLMSLEVTMGKEGSSFRTLMDCFAQSISLGLKQGVPLGKYIEAFKGIAFDPSGYVTGYSSITQALSPLDLLARILELKYPNQIAIHVKPLLKLQSECASRRTKAVINGHVFTLHTGETEDGKLAEVFFKINREGSMFCSLMSAFAKSISIALQYGVKFDDIYHQFIGTNFDPCGIVTGHDSIKMTDSIVDFSLRCLAQWYAPYLNTNHINTNHINNYKYALDVDSPNTINNKDLQLCIKCSSFKLQKSGTCWVCVACGETTGCAG